MENILLVNKISDHFPVLLFLHSNSRTKVEKEFSSRNLTDDKVNKFKVALRDFNWNFVTENNDAQLAFSDFSNTFHHLYNLYFPIVTTKFNKKIHKIEKWMTKGILISRLNKIKLGKLCFMTPSITNSIKFKNYRNIYNTVIRNAKKLFYEKELLMAQSNLKKTWSILKNAINKPSTKSSNIESLNIDGATVNDPKVLANELNIFFSSVASKIADEIHPVLPPNNNVVTEINDNIVQNGIPLLSFVDDPVTPLEIVETLETLQPKTSQDFNGLSMFLVKKLSYQLAKPLCHLFNLSFSQGIVPSQMKIAKIIPVYKRR